MIFNTWSACLPACLPHYLPDPLATQSLQRDGIGSVLLEDFAGRSYVEGMRAESQRLWEEGRFEESYSEVTEGATGDVARHYKKGVHSLELAGDEVAVAPLLLPSI